LSRKKRGIKELINIEWAEIDRCLRELEKGGRSEKLRIRWSRLLASHVKRLDTLMWKAGLGKLEEESLAKLLEKVPLRYHHIILEKVQKHEKTRKTKET